eukprot:gene6028-10030_t
MFEETAFMFQDEPKLWESQLEDFHTEDANPLFLIQGFLNEPKEKQSGGKMNRIPLQRHVILIDVEQLFRGGHDRIYQSELRGLSIQAVVCGHDRLTKEKIEIETVETVKMSKNEKTNVYLPEGKEEWFCVFDHLVIKESSHNYGQKLFLKFKFEINKKVYSIESSTFETISKRAIDKSIKKKYDLREDSNKKKLEKRILNIEPAIGFRSSLSKILISNLEKNDSILIYLGNKFIENYAILNNEVVFEIPLDCPFGELNLKIQLQILNVLIKMMKV